MNMLGFSGKKLNESIKIQENIFIQNITATYTSYGLMILY